MYCEKCSRIIEETRCPFCGSRKIREPQPKDLCFLTEQEFLPAGVLEDELKQGGIPFLRKDVVGAGLSIRVGPMLDRGRFFVPFEYLPDAQSVVDDLFSVPEEGPAGGTEENEDTEDTEESEDTEA